MKKVCVDTNMLVWYVKRQATAGQEENIEKADKLFLFFEKKGIVVAIPSLVVGELMCHVADDNEREQIFDFINKHFEILTHDIKSARVFSRLKISQDRKALKQFASENGIDKFRMTNDHNICAVAIAGNCDAIFSHNLKDFDKFNNNEIPVYTLDFVDNLPDEATQDAQVSLELFPPTYQDDEEDFT